MKAYRVKYELPGLEWTTTVICREGDVHKMIPEDAEIIYCIEENLRDVKIQYLSALSFLNLMNINQ